MQIDLDTDDMIRGETLVTNKRLVFENRGFCVVLAFDPHSGDFQDCKCSTISSHTNDNDVACILNSGAMLSDVLELAEDIKGVFAMCMELKNDRKRQTQKQKLAE